MTRGAAYDAMMARIALGTPFVTRDLEAEGNAAGLKGDAARVLANQLTQAEKRLGNIVIIKRGPSYTWQAAKAAPAPPPKVAPAVLRSPAVTGPLDPNPACEGVNTGLTELVGEWLFLELGGRDQRVSHDGMLREANPMEAFGWRVVADKLIRRLLDLGLRAPGPRSDVSGTWTVPWNYNIGDWTVQDEDGGFVAHLCDGDAACLITAAPTMWNAILAVLQRYDEHGAIKREDIETLRGSLPNTED